MPAAGPNLRVRGAVEAMICLAAPCLDLLLAAGDRMSRVLEHEDRGYALVRMDHHGSAAPRGVAGYPRRSDRR